MVSLWNAISLLWLLGQGITIEYYDLVEMIRQSRSRE